MNATPANPLLELGKEGQSVWLDFIDRNLIQSGQLARLIEQDGVSGLTSNPAIFEKAMATGAEYAGAIGAAALAGMVALTIARWVDGKWDPVAAISGILGGLVVGVPMAVLGAVVGFAATTLGPVFITYKLIRQLVCNS